MKKKDKLDLENLNEVISLSKKILKIGLFVATVFFIILILYLLKSLKVFNIIKELLVVISPVFIGLLIAWLLDPLVKYLTSKKIPRILSCIIVYIIIIGGIFLLLIVISPSFINQIKDFVGTVPSTIADLKNGATSFLNTFSKNYDIDTGFVKEQLFGFFENASVSITTNLPNMLFTVGKSIVSGGMILILGLMIGFYMLFDFDKMNAGILKIMPKNWRKNTIELTNRINQSLRGYVQGVLMVMFLVFISQSIGLSLAGLKAPLIFALFCALTDIIPYFGPYIGAIPALIVGFTMSPVVGVCVIISIVVVQLLENNFYQPLIMGHQMKLHPVTIMLGILIFQHFFGIIGMIVATPVIACLKVIFAFINEKVDIINKLKA